MLRPPAFLAVSVACLPLFLAAQDDSPSARGVAGPPAPPVFSLTEVREDPAAFVGCEVRLVLQVEGELDAWQPHVTRFGPGDFAGFRAWSDEAFLWDPTAFAGGTERIFARRGTPAAAVLRAGRPYRRLAVTAVVREVLLGEPWLEVIAAELLGENVGEGTILHASRGLELLIEGQAELARDQLERARVGLLPPHQAAELDRLIEACGE